MRRPGLLVLILVSLVVPLVALPKAAQLDGQDT